MKAPKLTKLSLRWLRDSLPMYTWAWDWTYAVFTGKRVSDGRLIEIVPIFNAYGRWCRKTTGERFNWHVTYPSAPGIATPVESFVAERHADLRTQALALIEAQPGALTDQHLAYLYKIPFYITHELLAAGVLRRPNAAGSLDLVSQK